MTRDTFLRNLRKTPRRWRLREGQTNVKTRLRCAKGDCPITAVLRLKEPDHDIRAGNYRDAAIRLGLSFEDAEVIASTADGDWNECPVRPQTRLAMLRACGLSK